MKVSVFAIMPLLAGKFPMQNVTSVQWLPPRSGPECLIVAGVADGSLYVFKVGTQGKAYS
jgi:hypothetical protein